MVVGNICSCFLPPCVFWGIELLSSGLAGIAFVQEPPVCSHLFLAKACFPHDSLDCVFSVWETAVKMLESFFFLSYFRW